MAHPSSIPNILFTTIYKYQNLNRSSCSYVASSSTSLSNSFDDIVENVLIRVNPEENQKLSFQYDQ